MSLWAVVPVKPFRLGKSRLSSMLTEEERFALNSTLYGNTMRSLTACREIERILVVSKDLNVLSIARGFGARTIQEENFSNLNFALHLATRFAVFSGAVRLLIIPADLPLLSSKEIDGIIAKSMNPKQMVICPDRKSDGTNALLVAPADSIEFQYGPGSYLKHIAEAEKVGLQVEIYRSRALELDLDLPEDLEFLKQVETNAI